MKPLIKNFNFITFSLLLLLMLGLQSYSHFSTSLLSILPESEGKELLKNFDKTQNSKILLLSVKGLDESALEEIQSLEEEIKKLNLVISDEAQVETDWEKTQKNNPFFHYALDEVRLSELNVKESLAALYTDMQDSFFPMAVDKNDPFRLLRYPKEKSFSVKNAHLTLGNYGYLSYFKLSSSSLETHQELYDQVHKIVKGKENVKLFSPLFYYVENSQAIRTDVNTIVLIALLVLLLLYLLILRDLGLLLNVLLTLGASSMFASILLSLAYEEVSIFVFVFGLSISTVAIDYMFHHYVHGYYVKKKGFNKEVFYGFFTTILTFFILSFSTFTLVKQIALFSIYSLSFSYLQFAFVYPHIHFKAFKSKMKLLYRGRKYLKANGLLFLSLVTLTGALFFIRFDFNVKNLDYDNQPLKETEAFFAKHMQERQTLPFAIKAQSIDGLIREAKRLKTEMPSVMLPLASLMSEEDIMKNRTLLWGLEPLRRELQEQARHLGFKEGYFADAYRMQTDFVPHGMERLKEAGFDLFKTSEGYWSYGRVDKASYEALLAYDFTQSLSLKERFEEEAKEAMSELIYLGMFSLFMIILLVYLSARGSFSYALLFLLFPLATLSVYALFTPLNILHLFMMFILLAIGIDYAIYLSKKSDSLTKEAISYSLISTFAGFGVLVFSDITALYSLGMVASMGIISILVLLLFLKGREDES